MKLSIISTLAAALLASMATASPIKPQDDKWYNPPAGFESKSNGEIIQSRTVPSPVQVKGVGNSYQIMYRTTDSHGNAMAAITTLMFPKDNAKTNRLVSYQLAEDASYIECAPSYVLQTGGADAAVADLLQKGYIVNSPDYQGPKSAFTAGILSGHLTLDSIRAALSSSETTGVDPAAKISLWGYSGGSVPTGWAAQLQSEYAPELDITGAACGGYAANITAVALHCNGGIDSGFIPAGIIGLGQEYPEFNKTIEANLVSGKVSLFKRAFTECVLLNIWHFFYQDIFGIYFKTGKQVLYNSIVQNTLNNQTQGGNSPKAPLFIYQGNKDEVVPFDSVQSVVSNFCSADADLVFNVNDGANHIDTATQGEAAALEFLDNAMNGDNSFSGCTSKTGSLTTTGTAKATASPDLANKRDNDVVASTTGSPTPSASNSAEVQEYMSSFKAGVLGRRPMATGI